LELNLYRYTVEVHSPPVQVGCYYGGVPGSGVDTAGVNGGDGVKDEEGGGGGGGGGPGGPGSGWREDPHGGGAVHVFFAVDP
jgi:hypothetical protein